MSVGAVAHTDVMRSIELFGTEVAPVVRAEVARREAEAAPPRRDHDRVSRSYSASVWRGGRLPGVGPARRRQRGRAHPLALRGVGEQRRQSASCSASGSPAGTSRAAPVAATSGKPPTSVTHAGPPEGQRGGEHAGLVQTLGSRVGQHDQVGAAKQGVRQLGVGHEAGDEAHRRWRQLPQRLELHHRSPHDPQLGAGHALPGAQQRLDPLVGAQQAEEQHHRPATSATHSGSSTVRRPEHRVTNAPWWITWTLPASARRCPASSRRP